MAGEVLAPLVGQRLRQVHGTSALQLDVGEGWSVTIENEYTFAPTGGGLLATVDGQEPVIVAALEAGRGTVVNRADVDERGGLVLGLAGGLLQVEPCERFESWNVVGPGGQRVVSMPGGGLAVWS